MVQRSEAVFDIPSGVTARDVLYNDYIVVDDKEVWLRGKSDPKGGKVMTVMFTGIARRAISPNRAKGWKPFVAGGVSQRISCAQNHRFRPRADAAVAD
ncbi:MAG: hypothetical protein ACLU4B_14415, partial [Bilophila wadsworthia]